MLVLSPTPHNIRMAEKSCTSILKLRSRTQNRIMEGRDVRKPGFEISDQVAPGLTQTGMYSLGERLDAWNFGFKKKRDCTIFVAKTKALISCAVTAQLIYAFVFAQANFRGSLVAAQTIIVVMNDYKWALCEMFLH